MTELISLNSESATNRLVLLHGWGADANDLDSGRSKVRYWLVSIFDVTTKKITRRKTISIKGVISIERALTLLL